MNHPNDTKPMDCKDIGAILSGLVDDEIAPDIRHLAERHIASCPACTAALDQAEALDDLVAASVDELDELPAGFEFSVLVQTTRAGALRMAGNRWFAVTGWLAAAASLVFAATLWMQGGFTHGGDRFAGNGAGGIDHAQNRADRTVLAASHYGLSPVQVSATAETYRVPDSSRSGAVAEEEDESGVRASDSRYAMGPLALGIESARSSAVILDRPLFFQTNRPHLAAADQETLTQLAEVLEQFASFDGDSMKVIEELRRRIEADNLIARVEQAEQRLAPEYRPATLAGRSILWKVVTGPIDETDVRQLLTMMKSLDLISQVDRISGRIDIERTM